MMDTMLGSIKGFVARFSDIISNTIDADVLIADTNHEIVGAAFRYFTMYNGIGAGSLIAEVIASRRKVVERDKAGRASCQKCGEFESCKIVGFVGVPIFYHGYVVGAIPLILPQHRADELFRNIETSAEFLENMAGLLAGKIEERNQNQSLNQMILEREAIMDLLSEAVVFTDYFGNIAYCNKAFQKLSGIRQDILGRQLCEVVPHAVFEEYFKEHKALKNKRVYITWETGAFYGFLSSRQVMINGRDSGTMFIFQTIHEVLYHAQLSEKGSLMTLGWAEWLFPKEVIQEAKAAAVTEQHILIQGADSGLNEMLAKGMANYSQRGLNCLKILYCDNIYRDLMEVFLFDEFGELRDADQGTMIVHNVENLPYNIQERMLQFLRTGKIPLTNGTVIESDVRLVFTASKNLKELAEQGLFVEELYYRIAEHEIRIPDVISQYAGFKRIVNSGLAYYGKVYHKKVMQLDEEVFDYLYKVYSGNGLNYLESMLELIVRHNQGITAVRDFMSLGISLEPPKKEQTLSDLEKNKIMELLKLGLNKTDISKRLGISRATLYRKMGEYGL